MDKLPVLQNNAFVDLQLHTVNSDGKWTPEQLIDYLLQENFALAAITDHDRIDTIATVQKIATDKNFTLLTAAEMTTVWRGDMTDILCYGFDLSPNAPLAELARDVAQRQRENSQMVYQALCDQGYLAPSTQPELLSILEKPSAAQPHALVDFVKQHAILPEGIPTWKIIIEAGLGFMMTDISLVVKAVHESGGVCLLAHPGRDDGFIPFDRQRLDQICADVPLDGLEIYYPMHIPEQVALYADYAKDHNLLASSGSDSHSGDKQLPIKYPATLSQKLLERLGIQFI